jgi:hypothetical protein
MKKFTLLALLFTVGLISAQKKMTSSKCDVNFEASVPFFEEVKAKNNEAQSVLIPEKSRISFVVIIKKFQFKRDLMREHFNTNYMESDRYPKAIFEGIIEKFDMKDINGTEKDYQIKGKIEIHGKSKIITVNAKIKRIVDGIHIASSFILNTDDFKIEIPNIVIAKVSKTVNTQIECVLQ